MKKFINTIRTKALSLFIQFVQFIQTCIYNLFFGIIRCCRGDLATNTIGAIIVAVVVIGLLVVAINSFFPSFFTDMFTSMSTKLNANW